MVDQVHVELIGLDSWDFDLKNQRHDSTTHHSKGKTAFEGQFNVIEWKNIKKEFNSIFSEGKSLHGKNRSAINHSSHQKTPAWIACMLY